MNNSTSFKFTVHFLRLSFLLVLFNPFLASTALVDGLFTAKELGLYLTAAWCGVSGGIILLTRKRFIIRPNPLDVLVVSLLLLPVVRYEGLGDVAFPFVLGQLAYAMIYVSLRISFMDVPVPVLANSVAETIGIIIVFHMTVALAQYAGALPVHYFGAAMTGMFFNPGPFGIYTAALVVFLCVLLQTNLTAKRYRYSIVQGVTIVLGTWMVFSSLSRSAWLGLLAGLVLVSLWLTIQDGSFASIRKKRWFRRVVTVLLVIVIFAGWRAYTFKQESADGRLLLWNATALMIKDQWRAGVGVGNFAPNYIHYQAAYFEKHGEANPSARLAGDSRYAFNDALQVVAEKGIIGALLMLGIFAQMFVRLAQPMITATTAERLLASGGLALVATITVAGLSAYPMQMVPIALVYWTGMAMIASSPYVKSRMEINRSVPKHVLALILIALPALFVGYGYQRAVAYYYWKKAEDLPLAEKHRILLPQYPMLKENGEYLRELGESLSEYQSYPAALRYLQEGVKRNPSPALYYALAKCQAASGDPAAAIQTVSTIKKGIPNLLTPRFLMAKYTHELGDTVAFRQLAELALDFEPKVNNTEVMQMKDKLTNMLKNQNTE